MSIETDKILHHAIRRERPPSCHIWQPLPRFLSPISHSLHGIHLCLPPAVGKENKDTFQQKVHAGIVNFGLGPINSRSHSGSSRITARTLIFASSRTISTTFTFSVDGDQVVLTGEPSKWDESSTWKAKGGSNAGSRFPLLTKRCQGSTPRGYMKSLDASQR